MSGSFGRIAKSLGVNILFLLLALGAVYLLVRGADSLSETSRLALRLASAASLDIRVGDARSQLMVWTLAIFVISWLTSSLFLLSAEQARPITREDGKQRMGMWAAMLMLTLGMVGFVAWFTLFHTSVNALLSLYTFGSTIALCVVLNLLAYYLATALAVKRTMRPSVPLGEAMPSFWS
jgi:hypothetical protein